MEFRKMLKELKEFTIALAAFFGMITPLYIAVEALSFHTNDFPTPYYYVSVTAPYTNVFLMAFGKKKEYWTSNAIGTERWLVRDVHYKNQTYWTILERKEI